MLTPTLMVVLTHPQDPTREAEFNEWYSGNHVPDVLNAPYWREAVRYRRAKAPVGEIPPYLALYQVDNPDVESANETLMQYLTTPNPLRLPMPPATPPADGGLVPLDLWSFWRKTIEVGRNDQSPGGAPKAVLLLFTRPATGAPVQPFNEWYDAHVRDIIKTPGIRGAARYELAKVNVGSTSPYLAIYELDTDDIEPLNRNLNQQREQWRMPTTDKGEPWVQVDGLAYFTLLCAPTKTPTLLPK